MAIRPWKPKPLTITPEQTVEQRIAGRYVCTVTWGSLEEAEKGKNRPYRMRDAHPLHDGLVSRIGWWGEQVVGHVGVIRMPIRLGRATLLAAGIAGVCADPRARNRGIASALMRDSLAACKDAGYSFSLLFGIANFYHRFGFVPAWPKHTILAKAQDLPPVPRWRARKARQNDLPHVMDYYNQLYGAMDGTAVRDPRVVFRRKREIRMILKGPGRQDWAYVICCVAKMDEVEQLVVLEAAGTGDDWPAAVAAWASRHAAKLGKQNVVFHQSPGHPVSQLLIFRSATHRSEHFRNAFAMVAVLDFAGLAREMAPEWCSRLAAAGAIVPKNGLTVRFRDEYYRWWPDRNDGRTERLPQGPKKVDAEFNDAMARLVMGYGDPEAVMHQYGMRAAPAALPALRAMFAERQCSFSPVDFF